MFDLKSVEGQVMLLVDSKLKAGRPEVHMFAVDRTTNENFTISPVAVLPSTLAAESENVCKQLRAATFTNLGIFLCIDANIGKIPVSFISNRHSEKDAILFARHLNQIKAAGDTKNQLLN